MGTFLDPGARHSLRLGIEQVSGPFPYLTHANLDPKPHWSSEEADLQPMSRPSGRFSSTNTIKKRGQKASKSQPITVDFDSFEAQTRSNLIKKCLYRGSISAQTPSKSASIGGRFSQKVTLQGGKTDPWRGGPEGGSEGPPLGTPKLACVR